MSEVLTEQEVTPEITEGDEQEETATPELTLTEAVEVITDGSRLAAGVTAEQAVEAIRDVSVLAAGAHKARTATFKQAAEAIARYARRFVLLPSGVPDWAGDSALAQTLMTYSLDRVLNAEIDGQGERKTVRQNILNHVKRTYLELEIRDYVANETTLDGAQVFPDGPDDTDARFLAHVRKQYEGAGIDVPRPYQTAEQKANGGGSGGGPGNGPANPITAVRKGIDGLAAVTARYAALMLLKGASNLVLAIVEGTARFGSSEQKSDTGELLMRVSTVTRYGAMVIDGVAKEKDAEQVMASLYSDDTDGEETEQ